ncbi:hypothetical protein VE23_17395 [Paenibacillus sp. D9]|uniref:hypothetical protein n=1 Tax=Paenibacillus sp. D9 TaxID=665792 RepID=UPI00061E941C|nr:hypothetical protein [Paenibacillus sp. D9]KKC48460.1 hypothetical protein VE23_17395 [Paenibacillus sp. D9]
MVSESKNKYDLIRSFPSNLDKDVQHVIDVIPDESHLNYNRLNYSDFMELRLSGETLYIPYRIYYDEPNDSQLSSLTVDQRTILYTMYTRHHDGFVRERNVKKAIEKAIECAWITPYLMLLIGEYVEEIVQVIYDNRSLLNADLVKTFVGENQRFYRTVQSRVVSYWDCYYRRKYPMTEQYVGFQVLDYMNRLLN